MFLVFQTNYSSEAEILTFSPHDVGTGTYSKLGQVSISVKKIKTKSISKITLKSLALPLGLDGLSVQVLGVGGDGGHFH